MSVPVYILARTPGAKPEDTVEWTDVCHSKDDFVFINYVTTRSVGDSGRRVAYRKRPFLVEVRSYRPGSYAIPFTWSTHYTLEAAVKEARKVAKRKEAKANAS